LLSSAHDCSDGGLAIALVESAIAGGLGAVCQLVGPERLDAQLFGEAPSRIVASVAPEELERLTQIVREWAVPVHVLGHVGGDRLEVRIGAATRVSVPIGGLADAFENGLTRALDQPVEALSGRESEGSA
jgi:phosphoribosylformylglycinamidine synthase